MTEGRETSLEAAGSEKNVVSGRITYNGSYTYFHAVKSRRNPDRDDRRKQYSECSKSASKQKGDLEVLDQVG